MKILPQKGNMFVQENLKLLLKLFSSTEYNFKILNIIEL